MIDQATLNDFVTAIHAERELNGCAVGFMGGAGQSMLLHAGESGRAGSGIYIVIEEIIYGRPLMPPVYPPHTVTEMTTIPQNIREESVILSNRGRRTSETAGAVIGCSLAFVSILALGAATGGVGLLVLGSIGAAAGTLQCWNGSYRASESWVNPDSNSLQQLDENTTYANFWTTVDAIGIVTGVAQLGIAARPLLGLLSQRYGLNAANASRTTIEAAVRRASSTPAGRAELEAALREVGAFTPQRAALIAGSGASRGMSSVGRSERVLRAVSSTLTNRIQAIVRTRTFWTHEVLPTVVGVGVSSAPAGRDETTFGLGSASGSLNTFYTSMTQSRSEVPRAVPVQQTCTPTYQRGTIIIHCMDR